MRWKTRMGLGVLAVLVGLLSVGVSSAAAQTTTIDADPADVRPDPAAIIGLKVTGSPTFDEIAVEWVIAPSYKANCSVDPDDVLPTGVVACAGRGAALGGETPLTNVMVYYSTKAFNDSRDAGVDSAPASASGIAATAAKGTATLKGLTPNTDYYVRAAAVNDRGTGEVTNAISPRPKTAKAPGPDIVTGVEVTPDDKSLIVVWDPAHPDKDNSRTNLKITMYHLQYRESQTATKSDGDWMPTPTTFIEVMGDKTTTTIPLLTNGTKYDVQVRAVNDTTAKGAWSAQSPRSSGTPAAGTTTTEPEKEDEEEEEEDTDTDTDTDMPAAGAPAKVVLNPVTQATDVTATTIKISWREPGSGASPLIGYQVEYMLKGGTPMPIMETSDTMITIPGLKDAMEYHIHVRGRNTEGSGAWSEYAKVTTGKATTTTTPTGGPVKMSEPMVKAGDKMLMVSWTEPASEKSITLYHLDYKTASATKWMDKPMNVTAMEETIDGLINDTVYLVRVRAVDSAGAMGDWSDNGSGTPMAMEEEEEEPMPTPALPLFGAFALGAGLLAAGRRRMRQRALRAVAQRQLTR